VDDGWLVEDMATMMQQALDDRDAPIVLSCPLAPAPWLQYSVDAIGRFIGEISSLTAGHVRQEETEARKVEADTQLTGANARLADANAQQAVPGTQIAKEKVGQKRREGMKPLERATERARDRRATVEAGKADFAVKEESGRVGEANTNSFSLGGSGAPRAEARASGSDSVKSGQKLGESAQGLQSPEAGKQFDVGMAPTQRSLVDLATQTDATGTETVTTGTKTDVVSARTNVKVTDLKKKIGVTRTRAVRRTRAKATDLEKKTDATSFRGFCDTVWCKILAIAAIIASFFLFLGWKLGLCQKRVEG
jgi:hypothetical protein